VSGRIVFLKGRFRVKFQIASEGLGWADCTPKRPFLSKDFQSEAFPRIPLALSANFGECYTLKRKRLDFQLKWEPKAMHKALDRHLRSRSGNGFALAPGRLVCAALLALLLPVMACAYTVVLRSGRRIEIPSNFTVTKLTLTYEAAPGINVTLLMSSIDVQATERANNEPAGGLLKRADTQVVSGAATNTRARQPRRELTKQDIEAARRARSLSEQEYERRRVELGLPSLADARLKSAEETKRLAEAARQSSIDEAQAESYWRARSTQLRTEIMALDAQINYVRARLSEIPESPGIGTYTFITGGTPVFHGRYPVTRFPAVTGNPGFMRADTTGVQVSGSLIFGGAAQGRGQFGGRVAPRGFGRRGGGVGPGIIFPVGPVFASPYSNYDYAAGERALLISRLRELEAERAGYQARWQALEEEARRAGALPGWLRP
jgi:hypothetical protein